MTASQNGIEPFRIACFTSGVRGYLMIRLLLDLMPEFRKMGKPYQIVGVVTDDPFKAKLINRFGRGAWMYWKPKRNLEHQWVPQICKEYGIPCYRGKIRKSRFVRKFQNNWKPDLVLMNVLGQILREDIFGFPCLGTYNFHTCAGKRWPSFQGPNPMGLMQEQQINWKNIQVAMHEVTDVVDGGDLYRFSESVRLLKDTTEEEMHYALAGAVCALLRGGVLNELLDMQRVECG